MRVRAALRRWSGRVTPVHATHTWDSGGLPLTQLEEEALDPRLAVRRREAMPPMARVRHADALDPVDLGPARRAVQDELPELALEIALHVQELEPEHLRADDDRFGRVGP